MEDASAEVRLFLKDCIDSVEQLRVLLLLFESPERWWTVSELTQELRSTDSSISKRLDDLYAKGVLVRGSNNPNLHSYQLVSQGMKKTIQSLAEFHSLRPYRVIDLIYAQPNEALQAFADAFRFKKGGKS